MGNDGGLGERIEELENKYGIKFPEEEKIKILEGSLQEQLLQQETSTEGLQRLTVLSAINRLYGEIEDGKSEVNEAIATVSDELSKEEEEQIRRFLLRWRLLDDTLLFYALSQDLIDLLTVKALNEEIIQEEYKGSNTTIETLESISQPNRENLLLRCGVLDHQIVDEMREFRSFRNDLIHDHETRHAFDFSSPIMEEVDKGLNSINHLLEVFEGEKYWESKDR